MAGSIEQNLRVSVQSLAGIAQQLNTILAKVQESAIEGAVQEATSSTAKETSEYAIQNTIGAKTDSADIDGTLAAKLRAVYAQLGNAITGLTTIQTSLGTMQTSLSSKIDDIKSMLTLADGEVTTELNSLN